MLFCFFFSSVFLSFLPDQMLIICILLFLLSFYIGNSLLLTFFSCNLYHQFIYIYIYIYIISIMNTIIVCAYCAFSNKHPLQVGIVCGQTKVNLVKIPGNPFFFLFIYFFLSQPTQTVSVSVPCFFLQLLTTINWSISQLFKS